MTQTSAHVQSPEQDGACGSMLTVLPDGVSIDLLPEETILAGLFRSGYAYRIGCRRGGCGICKVDLVAGEVDYNRPIAATVLTPEERATTVLTCRAVPRTDTTIELRDEHLRRTFSLLSFARTTRRDRANADG